MRKLITILFAITLFGFIKPDKGESFVRDMSFINGLFQGDEIFRRDESSATGWEWKDESGDWADMALYNTVGYGSTSGANNVTVEGKLVTNPSEAGNGHGITFTGSTNITIKRCLFENIHGLAIYINTSSNVTIKENFIANVRRGMLIQDCDGGNFKIHANQGLNFIWDRSSSGPAGGGGDVAGQFIQVSITTEAPNMEITSNRVENHFGESENEDLFNLFTFSGTSGDPFLVKGNITVGGSWSQSGGGIIGGEDGGGNGIIDSNYLVNPGRYGIQATEGADNLTFTNNKVYAEELPWNVVGYYFPDCTNTSLGTTNYSNYTNHAGSTVNHFGTFCGGATAPSTGQTLASMNMPSHLLIYMSEDDIFYLRSLKRFYDDLVIDGDEYEPEANKLNTTEGINVRRPTADLVVTGSGSSRTLDMTGSTAGTGGTGTNTLDSDGYEYVVVSGPNSPTITSPTASSTTITNLVNGTYVIRGRSRQNNGQFGQKTYDWEWEEFTVTGVGSPPGIKVPYKII